jgi:hypothetical protein
MEVDKELKNNLVNLVSNFRESIPIYPIRQLTFDEIKRNGIYFATKFMQMQNIETFIPHIQESYDSTKAYLSEGVTMRLFHNSNSMTIKKNMAPMNNIITDTTDKRLLTERTVDAVKKLDLEKLKLQFEHVEFERLWKIKANGIANENRLGNEILCRVIGAFRRYINKIPVLGRASIFVKLAEKNMIESAGIDWRIIEDRPIDDVKIINPDSAADTIIKNLNSYAPNSIMTTREYEPILFSLGYFSLPRRQPQNYMQPVYVAMFKSIGWTTLNRLIVIPASSDIYEPICRIPQNSPVQNKDR